MQYQILLQKSSEQHFVASVVGFSDAVADGTTEHEAVEKVKAAMKEQLATAKILMVEVSTHAEEKKEIDPWIKRAGVFADDPTWDDFLEEIESYRKQVDEETMV